MVKHTLLYNHLHVGKYDILAKTRRKIIGSWEMFTPEAVLMIDDESGSINTNSIREENNFCRRSSNKDLPGRSIVMMFYRRINDSASLDHLLSLKTNTSVFAPHLFHSRLCLFAIARCLRRSYCFFTWKQATGS